MIEPLYMLSGALTGFVVGLTGVGGGALMTPILLLFFGISPTVAVGTDLWFASLTKLFVVSLYQRTANVDWVVAGKLWMGSMPAAACMLFALHQNWMQKEVSWLPQCVALVIGVTAVLMLCSERLKTIALDTHLQLPQLTVLAGAFLGFVVTLTSVGAGSLGAVMLVFLYPSRLQGAKLIGTELAHAIPLALLAGCGYLWLGKVDLMLLGNLLAGSIPAALVAALIAQKAPTKLLRRALASILLVTSGKLLFFS